MVQGTSDTIMLTEQLHPQNMQSCTDVYGVASTTGQFSSAGSDFKKENFHIGLSDYLFVDAHVETLDPVKTLGRTNTVPSMQTGMWTIFSGD